MTKSFPILVAAAAVSLTATCASAAGHQRGEPKRGAKAGATTHVRPVERDAPDPTRAGVAPTPQQVIVEVSLDARGRAHYALERRPVAARALTAVLRERLSQAKTKTVIIVAPRSVPYREVVRVIDWAKKAGATNIGLEPKVAPQATPN